MTDGALLQKMVKPEVIWFSWAYTSEPLKAKKIKDAPRLFGTLDYDWVGSPYSDAGTIRMWAQSLKAGKVAGFGGNALGLVDTEWDQQVPAEKWGNIPDVSAATWNLEAFLKA